MNGSFKTVEVSSPQFKYVARTHGNRIELNEVKPFRGNYRVLDGDYAGKTIKYIQHTVRTMKKDTWGHHYDPKGTNKVVHDAVRFHGRSGHRVGIFVNSMEEAITALHNQNKYSVAYY